MFKKTKNLNVKKWENFIIKMYSYFTQINDR